MKECEACGGSGFYRTAGNLKKRYQCPVCNDLPLDRFRGQKKMKTKRQLMIKLMEIEAFGQLHYPTANIQINAPLALMQLEGIGQANMLRWVLGLPSFEKGQAFQVDGRGKISHSVM